jgi:preprotein translocase subunit SecB
MKTAKVTHAITPVHFQITEINFSAPLTNKKKGKEKLGLRIVHSIQVDPENRMTFTVDFIADITNSAETLKLQVKFRTLFYSNKEISDEFLKSAFMQQSPPAIAFPYLRSFILTLSSNAGIDPIILPPLNFTKIKEDCDVPRLKEKNNLSKPVLPSP